MESTLEFCFQFARAGNPRPIEKITGNKEKCRNAERQHILPDIHETGKGRTDVPAPFRQRFQIVAVDKNYTCDKGESKQIQCSDCVCGVLVVVHIHDRNSSGLVDVSEKVDD